VSAIHTRSPSYPLPSPKSLIPLIALTLISLLPFHALHIHLAIFATRRRASSELGCVYGKELAAVCFLSVVIICASNLHVLKVRSLAIAYIG